MSTSCGPDLVLFSLRVTLARCPLDRAKRRRGNGGGTYAVPSVDGEHGTYRVLSAWRCPLAAARHWPVPPGTRTRHRR